MSAPTPSGGDSASALAADEPQAIAFLRAYCAPDHWKPFAENDDYQLFGSLYLSDLRNALAAFDAALLAARRGEASLRDAIAGILDAYYLPDEGIPDRLETLGKAMSRALAALTATPEGP